VEGYYSLCGIYCFVAGRVKTDAMKAVFLLFLAVVVGYSAAAPWSGNTLVERKVEEQVDMEEEIRSHYAQTKTKSKVVGVESLLENFVKEKFKARNLTLYGFSYENCDGSLDLNIKKLTLTPDPIVIPGTVTVGLDAVIQTEVTAITQAKLEVKKKIFGVYIEIPCVDNIGSCTYNDLCGMLANITCPQVLIDHGFTCQCPFAAKEYEVPDGTEIAIPDIPLPSAIENGDYEIKAQLYNGATELACVDIKASLKHS